MSKNPQLTRVTEVKFVAVGLKSTQGKIAPITDDCVVALMPISNLCSSKAETCREDIEGFGGLKGRYAAWAFPRLDAAADKQMVVEQFGLHAEGGLETWRRSGENARAFRAEHLALVGESAKGKEISECEPIHGLECSRGDAGRGK